MGNPGSATEQDGGLRLVDLETRENAFKIQWISKIHQSDSILISFSFYHIDTKLTNNLFWQCNFQLKDITQVCNATGFWRDVVLTWSKYNYKLATDITEIENQILWYNSSLKIGKKKLFY